MADEAPVVGGHMWAVNDVVWVEVTRPGHRPMILGLFPTYHLLVKWLGGKKDWRKKIDDQAIWSLDLKAARKAQQSRGIMPMTQQQGKIE
eukprot:scaffold38322_cov19-Cyclotella_meneghiniana.AAC.2